MLTNRSTPDATSRQNVRNAIGQIESGVSNGEIDLRTLITEFDFFAEHGAPEQVAIAKVHLARSAVKLGELMPRLHVLLDKIKEAAGAKAMSIAESPVVMNL